MPKYADEKTETPKAAKAAKGVDTSGSATNVRWSTNGGVKSITKPVTPSSASQSRSR